ncbi:MAG: amidohydrolase family protein [Phycisphaeraceae bacterium]|nr:amidohydrolase family protein [Phycisphaeraceae bacterium]
MYYIDAHTHCVGDHPDCIALFDELNLKLVNIGVTEPGLPWRDHLKLYRRLADAHPHRFAWVTTFTPPDWTGDWAERVIADLDRDFAAGAVGCKVWKNIGMLDRKPDGSYLLVDDDVFQPVFAHLEKLRKPLLMHIAEPIACWQPPQDNDLHSEYYRRNPRWYMFGKPGAPSYAQLIAARDAVAARHPNLPVIGAHLASLEHDLGEIARRLEQYPNFAIDTAGRMRDLAWHNPPDVQAFLTRYQDRVLWSTDLVRFSAMSQWTAEKRLDELGHIRRQYVTEFDFFATDKPLTIAGRPARGLAMPEPVLEKLFHRNAQAWYAV